MSVHIVVDDTDARNKVTRLADALRPTTFQYLLVDEIQTHLRSRIRDRFAQGGDEASGKWEPLSEATVQTKNREGLLSGINVATGEMREFLLGGTVDADVMGGDVEFIYPREEPNPRVALRLGVTESGRKGKQNRDKRGRFAKGKHGNQPARRILVADDQDMRYLIEAVTDNIEEYVR